MNELAKRRTWDGLPPNVLSGGFHKLVAKDGLHWPAFWHADTGEWDFLTGPRVPPAECVARGWTYPGQVTL